MITSALSTFTRDPELIMPCEDGHGEHCVPDVGGVFSSSFFSMPVARTGWPQASGLSARLYVASNFTTRNWTRQRLDTPRHGACGEAAGAPARRTGE